MRDGFIKVAAITPKVKVADPKYNTERICEKIVECSAQGAKVLVFPELCITGYSCGDLFLQDLLLEEAMKGLEQIADCSKEADAILFVGLPVAYKGKLYMRRRLSVEARFWDLCLRRICRIIMNFTRRAILRRECRKRFAFR